MDTSLASPPLAVADQAMNSAKRKRSSSPTQHPPPKAARVSSNQVQINYLARQYADILPLITVDDTLPSMLSIITEYEGVLHRHESMAGNLGANPLGPILIKRFERLFEAPPQVLKTHGKEGTTIGWLDVIDFARNKPDQFNLEKMRDGVRVCQFYTKQCRVEISEEDFVLVKSGAPGKLIPPQPIAEDEEKELGTLGILEEKLAGVVQLADQVSARARQLKHRLKNRENAILNRRENEAANARRGEEQRSPTVRSHEDSRYLVDRPSSSPTAAFTPVNSRPSLANGYPHSHAQDHLPPTDGNVRRDSSAATRAELLSKFYTNSERDRERDPADTSYNTPTRPGLPQKSRSKQSSDQLDYASQLLSTAAASQSQSQSHTQPGSAVAIPNTPTSLLPANKAVPADRYDDSGPYKADMMLRMEQLNRGDRVNPPCDRCRRLNMDCQKNLTACIGCTKKHAKCSWKDVVEQELKDFPFVPRAALESERGSGGSDADGDGTTGTGKKRDWSAEARQRREVRDEELLGEDSDDGVPPQSNGVHAPASVQNSNEASGRDTAVSVSIPTAVMKTVAVITPPAESGSSDRLGEAVNVTAQSAGQAAATRTDGHEFDSKDSDGTLPTLKGPLSGNPSLVTDLSTNQQSHSLQHSQPSATAQSVASDRNVGGNAYPQSREDLHQSQSTSTADIQPGEHLNRNGTIISPQSQDHSQAHNTTSHTHMEKDNEQEKIAPPNPHLSLPLPTAEDRPSSRGGMRWDATKGKMVLEAS